MYGFWRGSGSLNVLIQQEFRLPSPRPGFQRLPCVSLRLARLATSFRGCGETPGGPGRSRAGPCGVVSLPPEPEARTPVLLVGDPGGFPQSVHPRVGPRVPGEEALMVGDGERG